MNGGRADSGKLLKVSKGLQGAQWVQRIILYSGVGESNQRYGALCRLNLPYNISHFYFIALPEKFLVTIFLNHERRHLMNNNIAWLPFLL